MNENVKHAERTQATNIELLIKELDEIRNIASKVDFADVMEKKYGTSESQVKHLIAQARDLDLLNSTMRFGKSYYLKRDISFASVEED